MNKHRSVGIYSLFWSNRLLWFRTKVQAAIGLTWFTFYLLRFLDDRLPWACILLQEKELMSYYSSWVDREWEMIPVNDLRFSPVTPS